MKIFEAREDVIIISCFLYCLFDGGEQFGGACGVDVVDVSDHDAAVNLNALLVVVWFLGSCQSVANEAKGKEKDFGTQHFCAIE